MDREIYKKFNGISVFFPAYNEEKNVGPTVEKAIAVLEKLPFKTYEVIVINDGSKDKTAEVVQKLTKKYSKLHLLDRKVNGGYGEAVKSGLYACKYDLIAFNDADGQFDFSEIEKFMNKIGSVDIVAGFRMNRQDPFIRKVNGFLWTVINNILFGLNLKDIDCAFKLIKKEVIDKIPRLESTRGATISPELLARAKKRRFKIAEVGVSHYARKEGNPTGANMKVILNSFKDLFFLWSKIK